MRLRNETVSMSGVFMGFKLSKANSSGEQKAIFILDINLCPVTAVHVLHCSIWGLLRPQAERFVYDNAQLWYYTHSNKAEVCRYSCCRARCGVALFEESLGTFPIKALLIMLEGSDQMHSVYFCHLQSMLSFRKQNVNWLQRSNV